MIEKRGEDAGEKCGKDHGFGRDGRALNAVEDMDEKARQRAMGETPVIGGGGGGGIAEEEDRRIGERHRKDGEGRAVGRRAAKRRDDQKRGQPHAARR